MFRYHENDPNIDTTLRTHNSYENSVINAEQEQEPIDGVKGRTCLNWLKYFKPTCNTCIDYMHSVLEGVTKLFFKYWFEGDSASKYSLRKFMRVIDDRLLSIKPPSFVSPARSVYIWPKWHAHEYLNFLLYFSIPVFYKVIPFDTYNNLVKLIIFMEILLSPSISDMDLDIAQGIITEFLKEIESLYDSKIMVSGVHELIHLADCTKQFGPLNLVNCFQFEELNRKFMRFIHGKDLIGEEFIKIFSTAQATSSAVLLNHNNLELHEYSKKNLNFQTSNRKKLYLNDNSYTFLSSKTILKNINVFKAFFLFFNENISELTVYTRLKFKGHLYTSYNNDQGKHCDSCFISNSGQYGHIQFFFERQSKVYVISKKISSFYNPFFCPSFPNKKSLLSICRTTEELFIEAIDSIKKIIFIKNLDQSDCFVSKFRSAHLFI